jgi:hypothetical protein
MRSILFSILLLMPLSAAAQTLTLAPVAPVAGDAMLRVGTQVPLRLLEDLTTKGKTLRPGQRFHMEVAEAVTVGGMLVIPVGSPAVGEITDIRNKGMWGKSGHMTGRVMYVVVNGRQIRLSGNLDDKGTAGGWGAAATSAIVFAPAGFFMTGTSAHLPIGTPVRAFVDEDVPLSAPRPAPLIMEAAQSAPPVTPGPVPVTAALATAHARSALPPGDTVLPSAQN